MRAPPTVASIFALLLPLILPPGGGLANVLLSIVISIPLLFPIAGVSYELQRFSARFVDSPLAPHVLATIHRPENTDDPQRLAAVVTGLTGVCRDIKVVLPLHPRTREIYLGE